MIGISVKHCRMPTKMVSKMVVVLPTGVMTAYIHRRLNIESGITIYFDTGITVIKKSSVACLKFVGQIEVVGSVGQIPLVINSKVDTDILQVKSVSSQHNQF
jgi:hypothetical protein